MAEISYTFTNEPANTVRRSVRVIPAGLVTALDAEWAKQQAADIVSILTLPTAKEAAEILAMAKQWGMAKPEGEQVTVRKQANKAANGDKDGTLRLTMVKYDANAPKPGRKAAK